MARDRILVVEVELQKMPFDSDEQLRALSHTMIIQEKRGSLEVLQTDEIGTQGRGLHDSLIRAVFASGRIRKHRDAPKKDRN